MKKYDLYLLDFDGTLIDTFESLVYVFTHAFQDVNIEINREDCLTFSREPLEHSYRRKGGSLEQAPYFISRINYYLNSQLSVENSELFPDTIPFIQYIRENHIPCGIVTSNNVQHVQDVLTFFHIPLDTFMVYIGNQEAPESKPSPQPILVGLKAAGYTGKRHHVAYLGDGYNDTLAANAAGVEAILVDRVNAFPDDRDYQRITSLLDLFHQ